MNQVEEFVVKLPNGRQQKGLAFKDAGTTKNLVILTGMNEHSHRYQELAEYLNGVGYDVYVLDAVGQGLNAPKIEDQEKWYPGAFDDNVMAANIEIEELKKEGRPTAIMGHSMGSFMVQRYLELYPDSVDRVILCGTNGGNGGAMHVAFRIAQLTTSKKNWDKPDKFLTNMGLGAYTKAVKPHKTDVDWLSYNEDNVNKYIADPYCGHMDTHGFWKEFLRGMNELYKKKWLKKISAKERVLIICGAEDPVGNNGKGPTYMANLYKKIGMQDVNLVIYPGMRHEIHNEKDHMKVYETISDFLNKK
jgi:alpha-beta hydrolase superfamily lysophospholipase